MHKQPVKDTQHSETIHHQKTVPVTEIREQHSSTEQDHKAFAGLHSQHKDQVIQGSHDKVIVDKGQSIVLCYRFLGLSDVVSIDSGEIVNENVHHHVRSSLLPSSLR